MREHAITLTKTEMQRLRHALRHAIDYENTFIDAHRTEHTATCRIVPREFLTIVRKSNKMITQWRKLIEKLQEAPNG